MAEQPRVDGLSACSDARPGRAGEGCEPDPEHAIDWYTLAAENGHATAQFNIGVLYLQGRGVIPDDVRAAEYFRQAAEQAVASAQCNLGALYEEQANADMAYGGSGGGAAAWCAAWRGTWTPTKTLDSDYTAGVRQVSSRNRSRSAC